MIRFGVGVFCGTWLAWSIPWWAPLWSAVAWDLNAWARAAIWAWLQGGGAW